MIGAARLRQDELVSVLHLEVEQATARTLALASELDEAALHRAPDGGGWSVALILEHLCETHDSYAGPIRRLVARPGAARAPQGTEWRASLMGRWLAASMRSSRRLPAPKIFRPAPVARPGVVQEFRRRQDELDALLDRAAPLDWKRLRTASPVSPLIRLNLGDCFTVTVAHTARHVGQMERVARPPGLTDDRHAR